jgi:RNA polymerase sigma factor (sigma-70 family)
MAPSRDATRRRLPVDDCNVESSLHLLARLRAGDTRAREQLMARYLPRLQRWARGRLPGWARSVAETEDLVQDTLVRTFHHMASFEPAGDGALAAYMRRALLNRIREEIRRTRRRPSGLPVDSQHADAAPSPLATAIDAQTLGRYRAALAQLRPIEQDLIVLRLEMGCGFEEIARLTHRPNANAARSAVNRAVTRLVEALRRD